MSREGWSMLMFVLMLLFLFSGDPDVFDALTEAARAALGGRP